MVMVMGVDGRRTALVVLRRVPGAVLVAVGVVVGVVRSISIRCRGGMAMGINEEGLMGFMIDDL